MNCMPFTYDIYYSYWSYFKWPALLCFSCCWNRNSEEIVYKNCWCIWLFGSSESWRMYVLIMIILWIAGLLVVSTSYLKVFQWCECIDFVVADSTFTESVGIVFSYIFLIIYSPSVLLLCWLGSRKGIRPVKSEWWGTGICLEWGANDLRMVQLMPLVPCCLLLQWNPEWFTFLVPAYRGCPGKKAVKWMS